MGCSNIFLQPSFPKEKGVILNDTCRIVLLIALSILETLFLKLGGMYYIEIDKLRDYQQKLNIHHFLSCSIFELKCQSNQTSCHDFFSLFYAKILQDKKLCMFNFC